MTAPTYIAKYSNSWAVVVGINKYEHERHLAFARNDASAFAAQLQSTFGFASENVTLLLDSDATLTRIRAALSHVSRVSKHDDRVMVFYAGHGMTVAGQPRDVGFLIPHDGDPGDTATLLAWDELVNTSHLIKAKHVLFIMDACYGGMIGKRGLRPSRLLRDMLTRPVRQYLTAGKPDQVVADSGGPRVGHSIFTGHLLDALDGRLNTPEGMLSANDVMAYTFRTVGTDRDSHQTPHFGPIWGDGEFFFLAPEVGTDPTKPTAADTILVKSSSPELLADEPAESLTDRIKDYLSDRKYRIQLNELVKHKADTAQKRFATYDVSMGHASHAKEIATQTAEYEKEMHDVLQISTLLGRWGDDEHHGEIREIVHSLAGSLKPAGGNSMWVGLRHYPMLLAMYTGGIAAVSSDRYANLMPFFSPKVTHPSDGTQVSVIIATSAAMLKTYDAFKAFYEFQRAFTPLSEYLFVRIRSVLDETLPLGARYEEMFDRFEVMHALIHADVSGRSWGPIGRFGWKYKNRFASDNPFSLLVEEAKMAGDGWPPLRAGLFKGSQSHFAAVAEHVRTDCLERLPI